MSWTVTASARLAQDLADLPKKVQARVEAFVFTDLPSTENPLALRKVAKLKGFDDYYKVRFGDYRLGLRIDQANQRIEVLRVLHRRDIYRHFP